MRLVRLRAPVPARRPGLRRPVAMIARQGRRGAPPAVLAAARRNRGKREAPAAAKRNRGAVLSPRPPWPGWLVLFSACSRRVVMQAVPPVWMGLRWFALPIGVRRDP